MAIRRSLQSLGLALVLLVLLATSALAETVSLAPSEFRPGQHFIGSFAVEAKVNTWRDKAAAQKMTLKQYAKTVLVPEFATMGIPVFRDAQGQFRNTDAHHKISALHIVTKETGVKFQVGAAVTADFSKLKGKAYHQAVAQHLKIGEGDARKLPKTYRALADSPMRSLVGLSFKGLGVSGSNFKDYVQFKVGDMMIKQGFMDKLVEMKIAKKGEALTNAHLRDPRVMPLADKMIFDKKSPIRKFLKSQYRDKATKKVGKVQLKAAKRQVAISRLKGASATNQGRSLGQGQNRSKAKAKMTTSRSSSKGSTRRVRAR